MFRFFPINVVLYHIYLLQLEEYNLGRFFKDILRTKGMPPPGPRRTQMGTTPKLVVISFLSLALMSLVSYLPVVVFIKMGLLPHASWLLPHVLIFIISFLVLCFMFHVFLSIAVVITKPLDLYLKNSIIAKAKTKLKKYPHVKIIGIAGSYGKTTMKELLASILKQKYNVLSPPKNINTPVGISRLINSKLNDKTEIMIVEMGEYYKGDIAQICEICKPDIGIITGINEAHFERLGTIETTIETIFELAQHMNSEGTLALNADDQLVSENYPKYLTSQKTILYSAKDKQQGEYDLKNTTFHEDASGISFELFQRNISLGEFKVKVLGEYIVGDVMACIQIAQELGLSIKQIADGIAKMQPVPHRLQPIYNNNTKVLVIDDSYNGNPDGVEEAIKVLAQFKQQRRIYLTPGLVEAGERAPLVHYNIGKALAPVAGLVILIRNSVTPYIEKGLLENGFKKENIIWFDTATEAHKKLGTILRSYDVILFQNDWTDNYY